MADSKLVRMVRASLPVLLTTSVGMTAGLSWTSEPYEVATVLGGMGGCSIGLGYSFHKLWESWYS